MDAADSPSTSSKVIDPYDLFDRISQSLESRLPLGNLHWKSPTRPLRSIDKLNVSFIREAKQKDTSNSVRRHQIPGLRQTPFVKLLLLRCDDRENYKDTTRKEVKEWLKKVGVSQDGKPLVKGQDRHDAFEYIIVHVVVPGTPAAAQPKSVKQITQEASDSTDSVNSKSKWPGKNATTVYDKLRADFGVVPKSSFERVAQIRITDPNVVPSSPIRPGELEELWQDLIDKLKAAILQSFDARVSQYEEDIRERESQRSLPGWNFCTFFILKEGLARGFENVGLIDDALTVYDELDAGLDKIVQDQAFTGESDAAGPLLSFSQDLKPAIRKALETPEDQELDDSNRSVPSDLDALIDLEKKTPPPNNNAIDYQQRILTNQVSALDLRLYTYTRRLRLLFRRARNSLQPSKVKFGGSQYDIGKLSEICAQALEFISFASRALRQDLYAAWGGQQGLSLQELQTQEIVIGNLVASWKVSAILQLLEECQISIILSDILAVAAKAMQEPAINQQRPTATPLHMKQSLQKQTYLQSPLDYRNSPMTPLLPSPQPQREAPHVDSRERLALWAAELFVVLRDIVKGISPDAILADRAALKETSDGEETSGQILRKASGIQSATLRAISGSADASLSLYRTLTTYAYRSYKFANQMQASRQMILSLAQMDFNQGRPENALEWLEMIPDLLDIEAKTSTDLAIFRLYLHCLNRERQPDEYARCSISILQFSKTTLGSLAIQRAGIHLQEILNGLAQVSKDTQHYDLPFSSLFQMGVVARSITHTAHRDGFGLSLTLSLCYDLSLQVDDDMVLMLQSTVNPDTQAIYLTSQSSTLVTTTLSRVDFVSRTTTSGWFIPSHLHVRLGNLHFVHSFPSKDGPGDHDAASALTNFPIMLYPRAESFLISSSPAAKIDLTQAAQVSVRAVAGDAEVRDALIRIRPATGGFRLNLHATEMKTEDKVEGFQTVPSEGSIAFQIARLPEKQAIQLNIPYSIENTFLSVVQLRIEVTYKIDGEVFTMSLDEYVSVFLPIIVNVQDIFQADATTLRFSAGPASKNPLTILGWGIEETQSYSLDRSSVSQGPLAAFQKLPVSWVVRVKANSDIKSEERKIKLTVHYECTDERILHAITTSLMTSLKTTNFAYLQSLLTAHLHARVSKLWTENLLEVAALTQEFYLWTFDEMQWNEIMSAIDLQVRPAVDAWLRSWHAGHTTIDLVTIQTTTRTLQLLVDIPQPDILIHSNLIIDEVASATKHLTVGKPVHATVMITCHGPVRSDIEVHYDISASAELWLIGGRKRGTFQPPSQIQRVSIVLVPQKPGHLLLPAIDIRGRISNAKDASNSLVCEVEHQNQAESMLVMPGVHMTTITTVQSGDPSHYKLLAARSR